MAGIGVPLITTGSMCMCSCGTAPGVFQATPKNVVALDMPIGTIEEIVPIENIPSFGMCIATLIPTPCIPKAVAPWMGPPTPAMPTILGVPLLNQECITMCAMGGAIGFTTPATPTVQMGGLAVAAGSTFLAATESAKKGGAGINKGAMKLDKYGKEMLDFMPSTDWFDDFSSMLDYGSDFMPENPLDDLGMDTLNGGNGEEDEGEDTSEGDYEEDYDGWSDDEPTKPAMKSPVKATNTVKTNTVKNVPSSSKVAKPASKTNVTPKTTPTKSKVTNQPAKVMPPKATSPSSTPSKSVGAPKNVAPAPKVNNPAPKVVEQPAKVLPKSNITSNPSNKSKK